MSPKRIWPAIVLFGALLACKLGEKEAERLEAIQTKACACTDNPCATGVLAEFKTAGQEMKNSRADEKNSARIREASKQITVCLMRNGVPPKDIQDAVK